MSANQCMILDDDELEHQQEQQQKLQEQKTNVRDLRTWLPEDMRQHNNPFASQYISTSHAFPKAFHMKSKEEYPKLSERPVPVPTTTMNYRSRLLSKPPPTISTINVLEKVREVLQVKDISGTSLVQCRTCGGNHWTLSCEQNKLPESDSESDKEPQYATYTPRTPPYPPQSPPFFTNSPPVNQIIYPIGVLLGTPIPPSSTPS